MARFGLGCFLEILSMVALFMLVVLPVIPLFEDTEFFDNMLQPLLCPDGEISREQYQYTDYEGTSYSMNVYCETDDGEKDVTGTWIAIGIASFLIPFLIGLFLLIFSANRGMRGMMSAPSLQGYDSYSMGSPVNIGSPMGEKMKNQPKSLSEKLQELEEAKRQGLISESEYQQMRQDILNDA